MSVQDIRLTDFRSYAQAAFEFGDGVNIIVGPNASGKTNLLEAVLMIARGSSYRVKDADTIAFDKPWARIESDTTDGARTVTLERNGSLVKKKFVVAGSSLQRLVLQKTIPVVVFEPDHLRLLSGGPERRRDYLDNLLEQLTPGYGKLRRDYKRTLAQRNRLLKQLTYPARATSELFVWNVRLSELAGQLVKYRLGLIGRLMEPTNELYKELSLSGKDIRLSYYSSCDTNNYSTDLLKRLENSLAEDQRKGFTSYGPHRDDLRVEIDGQDAEVSASRGESRTILLALKVMEMRLLEESRDKKPLLLLDDVFSELDGARRKALTNYLKDYQTFITTTDADIVVQHFMDECTIIPVSNT